jgi:aldose 1-epimerase
MWELARSDVRVEVSPIGASLVSLEVRGQNVSPAWDDSESPARYHGAIIAPWPNRIEDGKYIFDGEEYQLAVNELSRNNALHGLSAQSPWRLKHISESSLECTFECGEISGYPWKIALRARYELVDEGVLVALTAKNLSGTRAPFGCAFHPYFTFPNSRANWQLSCPASEVVEVDQNRLLPTQISSITDSSAPFRGEGTPDIQGVDHAYGGFNSQNRATLTDEHAMVISITAEQNSPWLQIHAPSDGTHYGQSVVLEPMSCPPNAFNIGRDVTVLESQETFEAWWRIEVSSV